MFISKKMKRILRFWKEHKLLTSKSIDKLFWILLGGLYLFFFLNYFGFVERYGEETKDNIINMTDIETGRFRLIEGIDLIELNQSVFDCDRGTQLLIFPRDLTIEEITSTFNHELGHYIWFCKMTNKERRTYQQIDDEVIYKVSDYSRKNIREDFAESYEAYKENKLAEDSLKYKFIKTKEKMLLGIS